ncbi:hypothetical protein BH747_08530 [Enterococcus villorum]|uniref:WxL domain-containing protein n=1 Tax=Enterococcus villorum TaxID=112904 RepID=A0A1V8YV87_9ENTE|nr:hypothetical protein [Enterococcus villorum]OQO69946.1 hypothetical protein BH747_08530 [Enterococcus villorum]OQO76398.1 hypothetical protein BH744_03040 [Enterococcus villorum]
MKMKQIGLAKRMAVFMAFSTLGGIAFSTHEVSATERSEPFVLSTTPEIIEMDTEDTVFLFNQPRITTNTFYGGVTGIPGFGTVWGEFHPTQRKVTVYAQGKERISKTGGPNVTVRATASRALTGNTSGWWWA